MLSTILRRSCAASRQTLAATAAAALSRLPLPIPSNYAAFVASDAVFGLKARSCGPAWRQGFHSGASGLGFRAGDVSRAQFAVDDLYEEEKGVKKGDEGLDIAGLGISKEIVSKLASKGITRLFPIQRAVLEPAMQGRDLIGRARTGTGKTLAFGIPIMDNILRFQAKNGRGRYPLAVVLAPTRELARQVEKEFRESSPLDTLCVYGGSPINQQARALNYGVDVVVGTPGRMIDLMNRGSLILSDVQHIVLDEADQMLAVGFAEDVEKILEKLPQKRHSMMFSATMPSWIRKLTQRYLNNPLTIDLVGDSDQKLAEGITLYSIATDNYSRASILAPLIKEHAKGGKCIVFTQTKRDADRLSYAMSRSLQCEALHGDIAQSQRERTLAGFRDGRFDTLIATDVAARGLDIPNVDLVIHYEIPNTSELFVHRSGRTGRAGKKGSAILIYTYEQQRLVRGIEHDVGCKFAELPKIAVEGGGDLFDSMSGGRGDSFGGGRGFGRSGSYGGSSFGSPRGSGGFGGPSSRYGESGSGRFGGSASGSSSGFGRSGGFGSRGQGSFGNFGDTGSSRFGSFGDSSSGRTGGFGNSGSGFSGRSEGSGSGRYGSSFGSSNFGGTGSFGKSGKSSFGNFGRGYSDE